MAEPSVTSESGNLGILRHRQLWSLRLLGFSEGLDSCLGCSYFVLMAVETLGEAYNLDWKIHMRCLDNGMRGLKHGRECGYRTDLDMKTLVATRGRDFPI